MTTFYVSLTLSGRDGPKVGAERVELSVELPDDSYGSFTLARKLAAERYAKKMGVDATQIHIFGVWCKS